MRMSSGSTFGDGVSLCLSKGCSSNTPPIPGGPVLPCHSAAPTTPFPVAASPWAAVPPPATPGSAGWLRPGPAGGARPG